MKTKNNSIKEYALAFLIQFAVLIVCILIHRIFINFGDVIGNVEMVGDEMTSPTIGRLIFVFLSAIGFIVFSKIASKKAKEEKDFSAFIFGMFAGTFLWQCIGEDLWHFYIGDVHFMVLESVSVFPLVILFVLAMVYCLRNKYLDWGIRCVVLSFAVNWLGHYVLIGVYPFFSNICSKEIWLRIVGLVLGIGLFVCGIIFGLKKSKTTKQAVLSAILSYYTA